MKRFFLILSVLAFSLMAVTANAQDKKCGQCDGNCAAKRADKIAKLFGLDAVQKSQVLDLNLALMAKCPCAASPEAVKSKAFKKEFKAAKKTYDKSLKKLIGKKNFRQLKGYDKVECNAIKAKAKAEEKAAKK